MKTCPVCKSEMSLRQCWSCEYYELEAEDDSTGYPYASDESPLGPWMEDESAKRKKT